MKIIVCGGRLYGVPPMPPWNTPRLKRLAEIAKAQQRTVTVALEATMRQQIITLLATGGAKGADELATRFARMNFIPHAVFPAQWHRDRKAAGAIRNQLMLKTVEPRIVIAFAGGAGTRHMVTIAKAAGCEVIEIEDETYQETVTL